MQKEKKKLIWMIPILIILISAASLGLQAYLSDNEIATNEITIGAVTTEIVEDFVPPEELIPGVEFTKNVSIKNTGQSACFVRIKAVFTDSDMEKVCSVDWNNNDFIYNNTDGYWYYANPIESGESTPSLFTKVSIVETLDDGSQVKKEQMKDFDIIIYHESYQAMFNGSGYNVDENGYFENYEDAWDYYHRNKPEEAQAQYFIAYYPNASDATGTMEISSHILGQDSTLSKNQFSRHAWGFMYWNTKPDGSGDRYDDMASINMDVEKNTIINLYAQWIS